MTVTTITVSGTWTCPAGITAVDIALKGGGGGGAGNTPGTSSVKGGGGQQGAETTHAKYVVVPGNGYSITIGAAGVGSNPGTGGGAPAAGGAGGETSAFEHTAAGGVGGVAQIGVGASGDGTGTGFGAGGAANTQGGAATASTGAGGGGGGEWTTADGVSGGNGAAGYVTITYTAASAAFSGTPLTGDKPLTVQFTGPASQTAYAWDFGDSTTATTQSPEKIYTTAGKKTVILATTNAYGFAVETKVDYVFAYFKSRMHAIACMTDGLRRI